MAGRIGLKVLAPLAHYDRRKVDLAEFKWEMDGR
jgi:hypothetical protein